MQGPATLRRQCADPETFLEMHGHEFDDIGAFSNVTAAASEHTDADVYNHFMRLAQSYTFFVQGTETGVQSHCRFTVLQLLKSLNVETTEHEEKRQELIQAAHSLLARAHSHEARKGASIAELFGTVYRYIAMRVSCELSLTQRLALTICPNNEEALYQVHTDMSSPLSATMLQRVPYVDETLIDDLNGHDMDALSVHLTLWSSCNAFHKKVVAFLHRVCEEQQQKQAHKHDT